MKELDILFITTTFNEKCLAKHQLARAEISEAGVYTLTLKPKKIIIKTAADEKGYRPWTPSYPVLSLTNEWNAITAKKH